MWASFLGSRHVVAFCPRCRIHPSFAASETIPHPSQHQVRMALFCLWLALAAGVLQTALRQFLVRDQPDPVSSMGTAVDELDFSDAADAQPVSSKGINYGCKCYPGDKYWPSAAKWKALNTTVDGHLVVHIPPGASCHNTFTGPLGTVNTYDAAACVAATQNWESESWT
ncbi:hypothetical protein VTK56DRAFT_9223 [Thermocarpiscus australiensis]